MKRANWKGSIEWRSGVAWVRVSLPRAPGDKLRRKRIEIANSGTMSGPEVDRAAARISRQVANGKIAFAVCGARTAAELDEARKMLIKGACILGPDKALELIGQRFAPRLVVSDDLENDNP